MREALLQLVGSHDFTAFSNPASQILQRGGSAERTICSAELMEEGGPAYGGGRGLIRLRIKGDGFLYHMVRIITGTVMETGTGAKAPEDIKDILNSKDRKKAGMTAPARGLCLMSIDYAAEDGT